MAIFRTVVKTMTWDRIGFAPGGFSIMSTLECGHQVASKGSAGYAHKRRCHQCEQLARGGTQQIGNTVETWDPEKQMPKRTEKEKQP